MILIDREKELGWLETAFASKKAEFGIIYGRRRLGKTFLVKKFAEGKRHFYFLAKQEPIELEFESFRSKFAKKFNIFTEARNWEELFADIATEAKKHREKLVIAIDEFPYWVIKHRPILSEFQYLWDELLTSENVMLILLGSYVSVMEQEVLGGKSPLFGRSTVRINLQEMPLNSLPGFLPKLSIEDIVLTYGVTDTIPYYLSFMDGCRSFREVLKRCLVQSSPLYSDAELLLSSELREYNTYLNILKAIFDGATKMNEISGRSKVDITNMPKYLGTLVRMRLLKKTKPATASPKEKNYLYELEDNYFKFWLTYIYPYKAEIEESPDSHMGFIMKDYGRYMGSIFEKFCRRLLPKAVPGFPASGRWWHKDKEMDIVALNDSGKEILFAECKWQEGVDAEAILEELKEKANLVEWHSMDRKENFAIFVKSFKKRTDGALLFDLKDLEKALKHTPS